jgi:hypothetical protein
MEAQHHVSILKNKFFFIRGEIKRLLIVLHTFKCLLKSFIWSDILANQP